MAVVAADATLEVVALWTQPFGFMPMLTTGPQATAGQPGGQRGFTGDFSGTRSVTFYDGDGVEMAGMDPLLTASIHMIVSGLEGEEESRTWNGSGNSTMSRSGVREDGTARTHESSGTVEYHDVVVPIPGSDPRYPTSGSITRVMTATWTTADGERTRDVEMVITFDGSSTAMAVVNGESMEIDLSAREGRNPLRHRRG